jgi:hypothetical protein
VKVLLVKRFFLNQETKFEMINSSDKSMLY